MEKGWGRGEGGEKGGGGEWRRAKVKNGRVRVEEGARWVGWRWKRRLYVEERGNSERGKMKGDTEGRVNRN